MINKTEINIDPQKILTIAADHKLMLHEISKRAGQSRTWATVTITRIRMRGSCRMRTAGLLAQGLGCPVEALLPDAPTDQEGQRQTNNQTKEEVA